MTISRPTGGYGGSGYGTGEYFNAHPPIGKTGGAGGAGSSGDPRAPITPGAGGAGGMGGTSTTLAAGQTTLGTSTGGAGGDGGAGGSTTGYSGGGGGGGGGGEGAYFAGTLSATLSVTGVVTGGAGGAGGAGGVNGSSTDPSRQGSHGYGGGGGNGGVGLFVGGGAVSLTGSAQIRGGSGAIGGAGGYYNSPAQSGAAGAGLTFSQSTGSVTLASGASIRGGAAAVEGASGGAGVAAAAALTVSNQGDIVGMSNNYGIYGLDRVTITANGGRIVGGDTGISAQNGVDITNQGLIGAGTLSGSTFTVDGATGVSAANGGTITNTANGKITGRYAGISVPSNDDISFTLTNSGSVTAVDSSGTGLQFAPGGATRATVTNNATGVIGGGNGGSGGYGIFAGTGTTLALANAGAISGGAGVVADMGVVSNSGTITASDTGAAFGLGAGVFFSGVGTVTSNTGVISGALTGVRLSSTGGVTTGGANAAITAATYAGVRFDAGGMLTNLAGGLIRGGTDTGQGVGVSAVGTTGLKVTNAGTITTGGSGGSGGAQALAFLGTGAYDSMTGYAGVANALYNSGTIIAPNSGAVVAGGQSSLNTLNVVNTGTIKSANGSGVSAAMGATTIYNGYASSTTTGHITGAGSGAGVLASVSGLQLHNYGVISGGSAGAVSAAAGASTTINLYAGSTTAQLKLGTGADTVAIYNGAVTTTADTVADPTGGSTPIVVRPAGTYAQAFVGGIDFGGGGSDVLRLRGAGDGTSANGAAGALNFTNAAITSMNQFSLQKMDAGSWTLTGAAPSTLSGSSLVSAGVLTLDTTGTWNAALNVAPGATLKGTATSSAGVTVTAGTFAPGDATGKFTSSTLSFAINSMPGATYTTPVFSVTAASATSFSQAVVGTASSPSSSEAVTNVVAAAVTLAGTLSFTYTGGSEAVGTVYRIIDNLSSTAISGTFANLAEGATLTSNNHIFKISYVGGTGNDVTLTDQGLANTAPTITGANGSQAITDKATVQPFSAVTIADPDSGQTQTLTVSFTAANGTLSNLGTASVVNGVATYIVTGSASAVTAALDASVFTPTSNQVAPGSTVSTTFTLSDSDGVVGSPTTNSATQVTVTSVNDAPVIAGTHATTTHDAAAVNPFSGVTVTDPDTGQTETATITLSAAANGVLSGSGITAGSTAGTYTASGTAAQVTAALQNAVFTPAQPAAGATVTTTFALSVSDTVTTTADSQTTVATSATASPASGALHDLTGDGRADILWRSDAGELRIWSMNGAVPSSDTAIATVPTNWKVVAVSDVTGDGRPDLIWASTAGEYRSWAMNGTSVVVDRQIATGVGSNLVLQSAADFNGDGRSDLLMYSASTGEARLWTMNANGQLAADQSVATIPTDWKIAATGDFDADGKADIVWRNTDGRTHLWTMNGNTPTADIDIGTVPNNWKIEAAADFNGDGKADLLWRSTDGSVHMWLMNGRAPTADITLSNAWGSQWTLQDTADFNGDGKADVLWRSTSGEARLWTMGASGVTSDQSVGLVGNNWHIVNLHPG